MLKKLGVDQRFLVIYYDNQSVSKNQTDNEKTKHIDIKLHFIRLEVSKVVLGAKFKLSLDLGRICER